MLWNLPYSELSKTFMDLMVWKYRFDKERYVKQINIDSNRKKGGVLSSAVKGHVWKESGVKTGKEGGGRCKMYQVIVSV